MTRPDKTAIRLKCPRCFNYLQAAQSLVGSKRRCPKCLHTFVVPSAEEVARRQPKVAPYEVREGTESLPQDQQSYLPQRCPLCRTHLQAREDQIGRQIVCPDCHTSVLVERPADASTTSGRKQASSSMVAGEGYVLADEVDALGRTLGHVERAADGRYFTTHCPLCGTHMQAREDQVGRQMTCPDCRRTMIVPPAPPQKPKDRGPKVVDRAAAYEVRVEDGPATDADQTHLIPVVCPLCETRLHATEDQIGQEMVCPDCDRPFVVPPPPKAERKYDPQDQFDGNYDIGEPVAPRSADSPILSRLEKRRASTIADEDEAIRPPPPRRPFLSSVFNIPWSPSVRTHFLRLWITGIVVAALVTLALWLASAPSDGGYASIGPWIMGVVLSGFTFVVATAWAAVVAIKGLAILDDTSQGRDAIESWPEGPFLD
ncbi:MAG TPA: hypothetical protein VE890_10250, partial [Thermoguttaceae bacterium]|nr:hypothetical protein [Thermoguttaceae bacterium]